MEPSPHEEGCTCYWCEPQSVVEAAEEAVASAGVLVWGLGCVGLAAAVIVPSLAIEAIKVPLKKIFG